MNVYDLIYVQLQLSLFRNEPMSQYSDRELSCGQTLCWIQKNTILHTDFWNQNIPLNVTLSSCVLTKVGRLSLYRRIVEGRLWLFSNWSAELEIQVRWRLNPQLLVDHRWIIPIGGWASQRWKKLIGTFLLALRKQREISLGHIGYILGSCIGTVVHSYMGDMWRNNLRWCVFISVYILYIYNFFLLWDIVPA